MFGPKQFVKTAAGWLAGKAVVRNAISRTGTLFGGRRPELIKLLRAIGR
jgi:hypothetical protein